MFRNVASKIIQHYPAINASSGAMFSHVSCVRYNKENRCLMCGRRLEIKGKRKQSEGRGERKSQKCMCKVKGESSATRIGLAFTYLRLFHWLVLFLLWLLNHVILRYGSLRSPCFSVRLRCFVITHAQQTSLSLLDLSHKR